MREVTVLFSVVVFQDETTAVQWAGLGIALGGIFSYSLARHGKDAPAAPEGAGEKCAGRNAAHTYLPSAAPNAFLYVPLQAGVAPLPN